MGLGGRIDPNFQISDSYYDTLSAVCAPGMGTEGMDSSSDRSAGDGFHLPPPWQGRQGRGPLGAATLPCMTSYESVRARDFVSTAAKNLPSAEHVSCFCLVLVI